MNELVDMLKAQTQAVTNAYRTAYETGRENGRREVIEEVEKLLAKTFPEFPLRIASVRKSLNK
jgi:hypothetical protein